MVSVWPMKRPDCYMAGHYTLSFFLNFKLICIFVPLVLILCELHIVLAPWYYTLSYLFMYVSLDVMAERESTKLGRRHGKCK